MRDCVLVVTTGVVSLDKARVFRVKLVPPLSNLPEELVPVVLAEGIRQEHL